MIKNIVHDGQLLGLLVSHRFREEGLHFLTPEHLSLQLAFMRYPDGKAINPHTHIPATRSLQDTQEVLVIKSGKVRVDFYDNDQNYLESHQLEAGDVILLAGGGHGFEVLEEAEMLEVKQGPYMGEGEKIRFHGIATDKIRLSE